MRFVVFRSRNTDPEIPAVWVDKCMVVLEDPVCSRQEEMDRVLFGGFVCDQEWDQ